MSTWIRFLFSSGVLVVLLVVYQNKTGAIPPLGRFFSPAEGFWAQAEPIRPEASTELSLKGLNKPGKVVYDDRLVPHIFAESEEDLFFLQGYVTAKHRLWQMDMQTRVAEGRLSEIVGHNLLQRDREMRRLGLKWGAKRSLALMMQHKQSRMILERYSQGVNAYISSLSVSDLPLEYKLLDFKPEPWTPLKCVLLVKYMSNMLTGYETDFELTNMAKLYGLETLNQLFPEFPDSLDPVIPKGTTWQRNTPLHASRDSLLNSATGNLSMLLPRPEPGYGSNNWALSGSRTANGKPILCNDPHLGLNLPSIWFEVQLYAPGMDVYGASIPGAPCVIIGFNNDVAWGITNAAMDVKDWYQVQFKDKSRKAYLMDSAWKPTRQLVEAFFVRGEEPTYDTILFTEHGPVAYDERFSPSPEKVNMALRWTAHDYSNVLLAFYQLNRARDYNDYVTALENFDSPGQNFVFASASGDIALRHNGRFVDRYPQQGRFVLDGTRSDQLWRNFIPWSDIPQTKNPDRGYVSSANQHPTDANYPYYYTGIYEYYRNRRLNDLLSKESKAKPEDMMRIQTDNYNLCAAEVLPWLLNKLPEMRFTAAQLEALKYLRNWTYYSETDAIAAVYFEEWYERFRTLLWDEFRSNERSILIPGNFQTWDYLRRFPDSPFIDNVSTPETETLPQLIVRSFADAVSTIEQWKIRNPRTNLSWANFKNTTVKHISQQLALSVERIQIGGNAGILNATSHSKGASWRMIVVPGVDGEAWGVYPGGQSGNPGSPHYVDFIDEWAAGKYFSLLKLQPNQKHPRILYVETAKP